MEQEKKHGSWLTAYLILFMLTNLSGLVFYIFNHDSIPASFHDYQIWMTYLFMGLCIANIAFIVLIWKWKKTGFYGVVFTALIDAGFDFHFGVPIIVCFKSIIGIVILFLLLRSNWKNLV